jgi:hypothetical protein
MELAYNRPADGMDIVFSIDSSRIILFYLGFLVEHSFWCTNWIQIFWFETFLVKVNS